MINVILYVVLYLLVGTAIAFAYMVLASINGIKVDGTSEYCPASLVLLLYPLVLIVYFTERFCSFLGPYVSETVENLKKSITTSNDD